MDEYYNQSVVWKKVSSVNDYNEPTYTSETIQCRKETKNTLVRNAQGQEVVASCKVFTNAVVDPNDLVDDRQVISSAPMPKLDGSTMFYEVYLI